MYACTYITVVRLCMKYISIYVIYRKVIEKPLLKKKTICMTDESSTKFHNGLENSDRVNHK